MPSKITCFAFIAGIFYFAYQIIFGASKLDQNITHSKLDEINHKVSDAFEKEYPRSELVKKTLEQREKELNAAVSLLSDAISQVENGNSQYYKILAGQLRALVATGSRTLNPLLLNLAEEKGITLICYAYSTVIKGLESLDEKHLVLAINPDILISHRPVSRPSIKRYEFKKWLNMPFLVLNSEKYTPNEIIRVVAEKEGGSHYDDALPEKLIRAKDVVHYKGEVKYTEPERLLYQTAAVVVHYGKQLLQEK